MFGVGPTELAFFLVILLLAVGPDRLPTFMRTVGKGLRQVRSASREFKDAIGLDELMREGDPFRAPPVRAPKTRPVPVQNQASTKTATPSAEPPTTPPPEPPTTPSPGPPTTPRPTPEAAKVASVPPPPPDVGEPEAKAEPEASGEAKGL